MKVVITRDDDGFVRLWPVGAVSSLSKSNLSGHWCSSSFNRLNCCNENDIWKLFGFRPPKGHREIVDITVKRLKK